MTPADFNAWTDLVKAKGIPMTADDVRAYPAEEHM